MWASLTVALVTFTSCADGIAQSLDRAHPSRFYLHSALRQHKVF